MVSDNIDRTAVVKLAVLGVPPEEGETSYDLQLQGQLHDFSYTLISDSAGDSYKFKLELINFNDTIHNQLIKAFSVSLNRDKLDNRLATEKDILKGFPKLLIQWGYPDSLSDAHVAQLSDIKYKFTQAKEKILIVEAVNAGDWAERFYLNANHSSYRVAMNTESLVPNFLQDVSISETMIGIYQEALTSIRGIKTTATLTDDDYTALDNKINVVIKGLMAGNLDNQTALMPELQGNSQSSVDLEDSIWTGANIKFKYQAFTRFFNLIGFQFNTMRNFNELKNSSTSILGFDIPTTWTDDSEPVYPIYGKPLVGSDTGVHGEIDPSLFGDPIGYLTEDQMNQPGRLENLPNPAEAVNVKSTSSAFDINSGNEQITNNINNRVDLYNSTRPEGSSPVSPENVQITTTLDSNQLRKLRDGQNVNISTTSVFAIDDSGEGVYNFPSKTGYITLTPSTTQDGVSQQDFAKSLDYEAKLKMEGENTKVFEDVISESYASRFGEDIGGVSKTSIPFSSLDPAQAAKLLYGDIRLAMYSKEGTSLVTSIKNSISNFNKLMDSTDNYIFMTEEDIAYRGTSFEDILNELNTVSDDSKYKASTNFTFTRGRRVTKENKEKLKPIKSFPNIVNVEGPSIINMFYGKSDSIVKYFDFTGDIRYLANMQASVATEESLSDVYSYLTQDALPSYVSIIDFLLTDREFRDKLTDKYKTNNNFIKNLEILRNQLPAPRNDGETNVIELEGLDFEFLMKTGFISTYLRDLNDRQSAQTGNPIDSNSVPDAEQLTAAEVFFATISTSVGISSMFQRRQKTEQQPKIDILEKALAIEENRKPRPATNRTYTLLNDNPFDKYKNSGLKDRGKLVVQMLETLYKNYTEPWEIKIKTLGIPEMDRILELIAPRYINFEVHDLSKELKIGGYRHWLTGPYRPMAINHKINNSIGYSSEFTLLKELGRI